MTNSLRQDDTVFGKQPSNLVCLRGSGLDKTLSRSMQRQHGLLLGILNGHKSHTGSSNSFTDGLRVSGICLVGLYIRFHELWRHQFHRMTLRL